MFTINNYTYESCLKKCKNPDHGERINTALIKNSITDEKIAAFIGKTCRNFAHILDHQGQSALHVAASVHKYAIVEWLINNGADVNLPDKQLGQTPLHRAIHYGYFDVAILLLSYGAILELNDFKLKSPVQYCCKPKNYVDEQSNVKERNHLKEILVWGNNRNYNLGLENKEEKLYPHHLDYFSKQNITIKSVSISCYHCLYLDDKGELYAVGLGDGGRLGTNNETTLVLPKRIFIANRHKNETVIDIAAAKNHSVVLTSDDRIFTCGINKHCQLGQLNYSEKSLVLRDIEICDKGFKGVIANDCYSLAYTSDSIYAWGLNVGQFGLSSNEEKISQPKKLTTFSHSIAYVKSSNAAIVCLTTSGLILLYTKFKVKTLKRPIIHESIKQMAMNGGGDVGSTAGQEKIIPTSLEIIMLTSSDTLFLWSNDIQKYIRCYTNTHHGLSLQQLCWCGKNLLFISNDGNLYHGVMTKHLINANNIQYTDEEFVEQKSNRRQDICENSKYEICLTRISNIDRVTDVCVDQRGESFVILQENSKRYLSVPVLADDPITFKSLLTETNEHDTLHDIIFHVEDEIFPAHKYIVFSRAEGLRDIVKKYTDKHIYLNFEGLTSKMFELIMKYIYENHTLTMTDIEDVESSFDPYSGLSNLDIYTLFREYMGKFGVAKLFDRMMGSTKNKEPTLRFNRLSYPELYDITIKCANNLEIKAHRCVLSTQLEYFNLMLNNTWSEATKDIINLTTVQKEHMEPIINFLYNNDAYVIRKQQYTETFLYHLIEICDQFFVNRLKNILEIIMIEKMTARKCGDMYEFAGTFNCELLEAAALDYICQNMGRLLENHCLDHLQIESLETISEHYKQMFQFSAMDQVITTLYADCLTDETVLAFGQDFQIDLSYKFVDDASKQTKAKKIERLSSDRRNYEKEAINLVKNLSTEPNVAPPTKVIDESIIVEAEELSKALAAESAKWFKVTDKKDVKNKLVLAGLKANDILKAELKEREKFTPLKSGAIQANDDHSDLDQSFSSTVTNASVDSATDKSSTFNLSFGDFTPQKGGKISQKQRKLQLSQTEHMAQSLDVSKTLAPTQSPSTPVEVPNAWKTNVTPDQSTSKQVTPLKSQPINIACADSVRVNLNDSFFSISPSTSARSLTSKSPRPKPNSSFSKILEDERKQKEYFNKMKSRSLLLTQMEETAIAELKKFYNVENVFDEHIEIERKPYINPTANFAEWKHN